MDLAALKTELDLPAYSGMSDEDAANALNAGGKSVNRDSVTGGEIAASVVRAELTQLTAAEQNHVRALFACASIPLTANFRGELGAIFLGGTATRTNLVALLKRPGSRAEELELGFVTPSHVANARRLP